MGWKMPTGMPWSTEPVILCGHGTIPGLHSEHLCTKPTNWASQSSPGIAMTLPDYWWCQCPDNSELTYTPRVRVRVIAITLKGWWKLPPSV